MLTLDKPRRSEFFGDPCPADVGFKHFGFHETSRPRPATKRPYPKPWQQYKSRQKDWKKKVEAAIRAFAHESASAYSEPQRWPVPTLSVRREFHRLADMWETETRNMSSPNAIARHPVVGQIVAMGKTVLPLILDRIRHRPWFWFDALLQLAKKIDPAMADPVLPSMYGDMQKMTDAWIRWGQKRGLTLASPSKQSRFPILEPERFYAEFPKLTDENHEPTSPATPAQLYPTRPYQFYNCFAYVVGDKKQFWWPAGYGYWPRQPSEETVEELMYVLETMFDYEECDNGTCEPGVKKVAIFERGGLRPKGNLEEQDGTQCGHGARARFAGVAPGARGR